MKKNILIVSVSTGVYVLISLAIRELLGVSAAFNFFSYDFISGYGWGLILAGPIFIFPGYVVSLIVAILLLNKTRMNFWFAFLIALPVSSWLYILLAISGWLEFAYMLVPTGILLLTTMGLLNKYNFPQDSQTQAVEQR